MAVPKKNIKEFVRSTDLPITPEHPLVAPLKQVAQSQYGVEIGFFDYQNNFPGTKPESGLYCIVVPDVRTLGVLMDGTVSLRGVLLDNVEKHPNEVPCYYNAIYLGDIDKKNEFQKLRQIEKGIKNVSIAKYAFQEFGYDLPRTLQQVTIDKFERYDNIRHAADLRPEVKAQYEQVYKDAVDYANSIYNKDVYTGYPIDIYHSNDYKKNLVDRDYFEKNHITQVNEVVSEQFWEYLKTRMPESPGFQIWKDKKPSLVLQDNSDAKGIKGINIWAKQKGYKEYNVAFARGKQSFFYSWLLDYQYRDCRALDQEERMLHTTTKLQPIEIPQGDMNLWDAYCENNNVKYCLNHGLFGANCADTIRTPIVGVRAEDRPVVDAILKRISEDRIADKTLTKDRMDQLNHMPRKAVNNPYLKLLHLQSRTDVWLDDIKAGRV